MPKVVFQIEGGKPVTVDCNVGDNLLELARRANVAIDAPCSGNGSCGKCRIKLVEGELESYPSRHISDEEYAEGWRLSCSSKVVGDCTVFVPDIASAYQSRMKTADLSSPQEVAIFDACQSQLKQSGIHFTNRFRAVVVTMAEPSLDDTMPDNERLTWALEEALGVEKVEIPFCVMVKLAHVLRENSFHVCVKGELLGDTFRCMEVCAPEDTAIVGCAIDIGTTTVTMVLTDLTTGKILAKGSSGNGQIRYGADVINRIIEQGKPGGRKKLQDAILKETLNPIIANLCKSAGVTCPSVLRMSVGANTTMNHLLVGVDAQSVRMDPYIPSFFLWNGLLAQDLKIPANPLAPVLIAPNIGSYVGGDITAGTLASGIWDSDALSLFIDLGTNGEIVFGNRDFLVSCACSAGPAFEGGDISCGMRATDGAIEACTVDKVTMEPTVSIVGDEGQKAVGICGSGIIDIISELYRCGIVNAKGLFIREGERVRRDHHGMGRYVIAFENESETGREVSINEVDIDNFIRAKGAIFSAIATLLQSVDMPVEAIENVYVAGGIGSGINMKNAVNIGMFPDVELEKFHYIGNSSLAGAYAMVMSDEAAAKTAEVAANMTYLELSTYPGYMDSFVAACFLPHTDKRLFPIPFRRRNMLEGMHHVAVIASEEARTLDFYVNKLGFTLESQVWRPEQRDYLRMLRLGNLVLELFIKPDDPARLTLPEALGLRHLAFRVTNIQAARDWLNAQGIETEPIHEDKANGGHYVFFRDPDGLPLELHDEGIRNMQVENHKEEAPFAHYAELFRDLNPAAVTARLSDVRWDGKEFTLSLLGRAFAIAHPDYAIRALDGGALPPLPSQTFLLRYLLESKDVVWQGQWKTFREMPWGEMYIKPYTGRVLTRAAFTFGTRLPAFRAACGKMQALPMKHGDAGYQFDLIGGYRMQILVWEGDDEFPPNAQVLYSDNFAEGFAAEDRVVAGDILISTIKSQM